MKELDVLFERFARGYLDGASTDAQRNADRELFARLLDLPDPELADYFFGHAKPSDPDLARLTRLIATHRP
jgi:succinate dehydrogenase flavin-adding protein (antitoxin of CptAB toxin-antitoxin module)